MLDVRLGDDLIPKDLIVSILVSTSRINLELLGSENQESFFEKVADRVKNSETIKNVQIGNQIHYDYEHNEREYGINNAVSGECDFLNTNTATLNIHLIKKEEKKEQMNVKIDDIEIENEIFFSASFSNDKLDLIFEVEKEREEHLKEIGVKVKTLEKIDTIKIGNNEFKNYKLSNRLLTDGRCDYVNKKTATLKIYFQKNPDNP